MTIKELLLEGEKKLSGLSSRVLDCEVLLGFVLGFSRERMLGDFFYEPDPFDQELYFRYVEQVRVGKPVAYITNSKEFYAMDFYVDERVLIPRPETEMIVDEVLEYLRAGKFGGVVPGGVCVNGGSSGDVANGFSSGVDGANGGQRADALMLDIGTGSFNIPAAVMGNFENVFVHAVDISEDALEVARINRDYHAMETRSEIYQSDLLSNVEELRFDVVTANLPYVGEGQGLEENVRKYEPASALFGGASGSVGGESGGGLDVGSGAEFGEGFGDGLNDGLGLYKKLIQQIIDNRLDFGLFVGEFGYGQKDAILELLNKNFVQCEKGVFGGACYEISIKNDLASIPRIFVVRKV